MRDVLPHHVCQAVDQAFQQSMDLVVREMHSRVVPAFDDLVQTFASLLLIKLAIANNQI